MLKEQKLFCSMDDYGRDRLNPLTTVMKSDVENMKPAEERGKPENANL